MWRGGAQWVGLEQGEGPVPKHLGPLLGALDRPKHGMGEEWIGENMGRRAFSGC